MSAAETKRPLTDHLGELTQAIVAAGTRARALDVERRQIRDRLAQVTEEITEAYAVGDDDQAEKLSRARTKLETGSVRDADEKLAGAQRALARAQADRTTFITDNVDGMIEERTPDALAVAKAAEDAAVEIARVQARWQGEHAEVSELLRTAGRSTSDLPLFPEALASIVRDARRAGGTHVPPPLPRRPEPAARSTLAHDTKEAVA